MAGRLRQAPGGACILNTVHLSVIRRTVRAALVAAGLALVVGAAPAVAAVPDGADRVTSLPTLGPVTQPQFAGYASASAVACADLRCSDRPGLFYWLVGRDESYRTRPTILWSNGGPGASSFYGLLSENGPYDFGPGDVLRPFAGSWTSVANYLMFDHPLGVGMSFPYKGRIAKDLRQGTDQLAAAVGQVVRRDGLERSPLYLTGESYGGTYMPLLAQRLLDTRSGVKVGGVVIADGWVAPEVQVGSTADYAVQHGLISAAQKKPLDRLYARCRKAMRDSVPSSLRAGRICQSIQDRIAEISGRWLGNIGQDDDVDYTPIERYLNRPDVREAIHARTDGTFTLGSDAIAKRYARGVMDDYTKVVADLLDRGVPVMVFTGLDDAKDANFLGVRRWVARMRWKGAARYARAPQRQWRPDGAKGQVLGYQRSGGGLTVLEVLNAGHLAARDEPKLAVAMRDFMG
jgi:vitellogenic carboxypeptidase-like protein